MIYNDDCKKIIEAFDNLLPWDKGEVIKSLVNNHMTEDEIFKYFIEGTGYVKYDDIDLVNEVIDNNKEYEVLDEMYDGDILDYLLNSYRFNNNSSNLTDWLEKMMTEDVVDALYNLNDETKEKIIETFYSKYKSSFVNLLKCCIDVLNKKDE